MKARRLDDGRQALDAPNYPPLSARTVITTLRRHGPITVHRLAQLLPGDAGSDLPAVKCLLIDLMRVGLAVPMWRGRKASGLPLRVWRVAEPDEVIVRDPRDF